MANKLTIVDTRKMNKTQIETELGKYAKELEKLGMDHISACEFLSSVMNLGIAAQERWDEMKQK